MVASRKVQKGSTQEHALPGHLHGEVPVLRYHGSTGTVLSSTNLGRVVS